MGIRLVDFASVQSSLLAWQENVKDYKKSIENDSYSSQEDSNLSYCAPLQKNTKIKSTRKGYSQNIIIRHPIHGHAFARVFSAYPKNCAACPWKVWSMISASCKCLLCGTLVHRACCNESEKLPQCPGYTGLHVDKELLQSYTNLQSIIHTELEVSSKDLGSEKKIISANMDQEIKLL